MPLLLYFTYYCPHQDSQRKRVFMTIDLGKRQEIQGDKKEERSEVESLLRSQVRLDVYSNHYQRQQLL